MKYLPNGEKVLSKEKLAAVGILVYLLISSNFVFPQENRGVGLRQTAQAKLALVIGNGAYQHTTPLTNPPNDATDMASTLRELGFEVMAGTNQTKQQMENIIREFGNRLRDTKGVGLVFYAGHGIQSDGSNYLIPVDADIKDEDEVANFSVNLSFLLAKMNSAGNGFNIVILDACRNNPFARSWRNYRDIGEKGGLAKVDAPTGTLIAYATRPGATASDGDGKNGLYTSVLLKQMRIKNVDVTKMLQNVRGEVLKKSSNQQVPFDESSLVGDFYFAGKDEIGGGSATITAEDKFWSLIENGTDVDDFKLYKQKYPNGTYLALADLKIKQLGRAGKSSSIAPGTVFSNTMGMKFGYIPAGEFQMGGKVQVGEPVHTVRISEGFWLGQTEVTQAEWQAVMGSNPSKNAGCPKCPVEQVSWDDAWQFINKLNALSDGYSYRLPTEAEWEYGCRSGTTGDFAGNLDSMAWYGATNYENKPHEVGTKSPNAWGLYDLHGNVLEWVQDLFGNYAPESVTDPNGPPTGTSRVVRGGAFDVTAPYVQSAFRNGYPQSLRNYDVGFRLVRTN